MRRQAGVSLLELLLVAAVISVMVGIALPAYQAFVLAAGRADARSLLHQVAADQEQYHLLHGTYSGYAAPLSDPPASTVVSGSGGYRAEVRVCDGGAIDECYIVEAVAIDPQSPGRCQLMTLDSTGLRGPDSAAITNCWQ